jgi:hypothetical protein
MNDRRIFDNHTTHRPSMKQYIPRTHAKGERLKAEPFREKAGREGGRDAAGVPIYDGEGALIGWIDGEQLNGRIQGKTLMMYWMPRISKRSFCHFHATETDPFSRPCKPKREK